MRVIVRLIPNAKLSSLPLNHFAMAVVTATISDSAPIPNTNRPIAITQKTGVAAVMMAPIRQMIPKSSKALRAPMRSMMNPPIRTVAIGAML